jgi:rhomboid protease GluP
MIKTFLRDSPGSLCLAASIVVAWFAAAYFLGQSPLASQRSGLLLELGAVNGGVLETQQWWRLVTSQFLHVHLLHMLFNALCIWIVGGFIEQASGAWRAWVIYFVGGCLGQAASVMGYPTLVTLGAPRRR